MLDSSASAHSFILPGESDIMEEGNQEGMEPPALEGASVSKKVRKCRPILGAAEDK